MMGVVVVGTLSGGKVVERAMGGRKSKWKRVRRVEE